MKFVGVREFKEDVVKYLNEGSEIVVMKRKRPIARLTPGREEQPGDHPFGNWKGVKRSRGFKKRGA